MIFHCGLIMSPHQDFLGSRAPLTLWLLPLFIRNFSNVMEYYIIKPEISSN